MNYYNEQGELERFFVHPKNKSADANCELALGVRITFEAGART